MSQDSRLSGMWSGMRTLRVADGPDIVHMNTIVKEELKQPLNPMAAKGNLTSDLRQVACDGVRIS